MVSLLCAFITICVYITLLGKHDGTVKGVKYFKCKDKHGLFVRQGKIIRIRDPAITGLPNQNPKPLGSPAHQKSVSSSISTKRRVSHTKI